MVGQTGLEPVTPRLSSVCSNQLSYRPYGIVDLGFGIADHFQSAFRNLHSAIDKVGGGNRSRTDDILLAKQALYQLSYTP